MLLFLPGNKAKILPVPYGKWQKWSVRQKHWDATLSVRKNILGAILPVRKNILGATMLGRKNILGASLPVQKTILGATLPVRNYLVCKTACAILSVRKYFWVLLGMCASLCALLCTCVNL